MRSAYAEHEPNHSRRVNHNHSPTTFAQVSCSPHRRPHMQHSRKPSALMEYCKRSQQIMHAILAEAFCTLWLLVRGSQMFGQGKDTPLSPH